jgi:subtilisin family serine protease
VQEIGVGWGLDYYMQSSTRIEWTTRNGGSDVRHSLLALALAVILVLAAAPAVAAQPDASDGQTWIVTLDPGSNAAEHAERLVGPLGGSIQHVYSTVLSGFSFRGSAQAAEALLRNPNVLRVEASRTFRSTAESANNGFFRIDADDTYYAGDRGETAGGTSVRIAVLDTGIDVDHADLAPNLDVASSISCIAGEPSIQDGQGHGTHVSGIAAAASQGDGIVGVASEASIVSAKVLDSTGYGTDAEVLCGFDHIAGLHASDNVPTVINLSLGEAHAVESGCSSSALHQAICNLTDAGVVIVAAAGNNAADASNFYPAAYPETIAVSAFSALNGTPGNDGCEFFLDVWYQCDDELANFTNYGAVIDVTAPGVRVQSTTFDGSWGLNSGTSMAAPFASGVAALVLAADPTLSPNAVRSIMQTTGECPDGSTAGAATCTGHGDWQITDGLYSAYNEPDGIPEPLIDAAAAVAAASTTSPDTTPPVVTITTPPDGATYTVGDVVLADYTCTDADSGISTCTGDVADGAAIDTATPGDKTFTVVGTDNATNETTVIHYYTVNEAPDTTPPVVTITTPPDGATFQAGIDVVIVDYECSDADSGVASCIGDLPDGSVLDTSTPGSGTFTVIGTDIATNETTVEHYYDIVDTTPPVIALLGDNPLIHLVGTSFADPGAEVTDNVDATTTIYGVSTVDPDTPGDYTITYDYVDAAMNAAVTVVRDVTVVAATNDYATSEVTTYGTVTGDFLDTQASDGRSEVITEAQSGGKPSSRTYRLHHTWTIPFSGGDGIVHLVAAANGEEFLFEYSFDGTGWAPMMTITGTPGEQTHALPVGMSAGELFVRVVDLNRTPGDTNPSSVRIDHLYVESQHNGSTPGLMLEVTTGKIGPETVVYLTWSDTGLWPFTLLRNGFAIASDISALEFQDNLGKRPTGTFRYQVCDDNYVCSNEVKLDF